MGMTNHLTEFSVKNFRGLNDIKLDSLSRINIIAGVNGIGKTELLKRLKTILNASCMAGLDETKKIIGYFAICGNKILLIDDFGHNIHVEAKQDFAFSIVNAVENYNLQLFFTTHSKEFIDAFVRVTVDMKKPAFCSYYALVDDNGKVAVRGFRGGEYCRLVKAGNVDLRCAR
jgi:AAA15 family ATPase/GTPase